MKYATILCLSLMTITMAFNLMPKWKYEILSFDMTSNEEKLFNASIQLERVKREVTINAAIDMKIDCYDCYFEIKLYRSASGTSEYKLFPFALRKQHFTEFINGYYKAIVYPKLKDCSNFPKISKYEPPWEHKIYYFNKCKPGTDDLPTHVLPGYYKIIGLLTGEIVAKSTLLVQVHND